MTPENKIAVFGSAIPLVVAGQTRNKKAHKHIVKLEDDNAIAMIDEIIAKQEQLRKYLEKDLRKELKKRKETE